MIKLFEKYINEKNFCNAQIVIQNLFTKDAGNKEVYTEYSKFLISQALDAPDVNMKEEFADKANMALMFFMENTTLDSEMIKFINKEQDKLSNLFVEIQEIKVAQINIQSQEIKKKNKEGLKLVRSIIASMKQEATMETIEHKAKQIAQIDTQLYSDYFSEAENKEYENLTRECSEVIKNKSIELQEIANKNYNLQAVNAYKKVFDTFNGTLNCAPNGSVFKEIFAFDPNRLSNETLVYYNHVYSFLLSKLSEDEKYQMTKAAVLSDKRRK